jgi:hypothetical protein
LEAAVRVFGSGDARSDRRDSAVGEGLDEGAERPVRSRRMRKAYLTL